MENYNFKVIARLRDDLTDCKAQPIHNYDDFGAVALFFSALKDMQRYFSKLEYYDLWEGNKRVAV